MNEKTKKRLHHDALAACHAIQEFAAGRTFAEYELMLRSATEL